MTHNTLYLNLPFYDVFVQLVDTCDFLSYLAYMYIIIIVCYYNIDRCRLSQSFRVENDQDNFSLKFQ